MIQKSEVVQILENFGLKNEGSYYARYCMGFYRRVTYNNQQSDENLGLELMSLGILISIFLARIVCSKQDYSVNVPEHKIAAPKVGIQKNSKTLKQRYAKCL